MGEMITWAGRPSLRPHIIGAVASGALALFLLGKVGPAFQLVINATADRIFWSDSTIMGVYRALQVLVFLPLALFLCKALCAPLVKYEVADGRMLYHHGLLIRKHDQILLQRVRDFRVYRPLWQMIVGVGTVYMVSRDDTWPTLTLGPFASPLEVKNILHMAVVEHQEATGYRELESTRMNI